MALKHALIISVFTTSILFVACGDAGTNVNVAVNSSNSNSVKANSNSPVAATTPAPEQTTNNAPTLSPVFKAYCLAMEKKDEAGIRKVYSKDTIEDFEKDMKAEGSKTLAEYLSTDQVTTALCEIRNEVITGDTAIAEVKTAGMPNGEKIVFAKEGNDWKITNRSPALDAVKQTATNSNSGK
jgi:hypothetical protein